MNDDEHDLPARFVSRKTYQTRVRKIVRLPYATRGPCRIFGVGLSRNRATTLGPEIVQITVGNLPAFEAYYDDLWHRCDEGRGFYVWSRHVPADHTIASNAYNACVELEEYA